MKRTPKPIKTGYLPEKDGHKVFFSQYGKADGTAILKLHGGPGSKSKPSHAAEFDLDQYQVITFDQRGCGKSEAKDVLAVNTTIDLIDDIERLRQELSVETWFVSGSSWGAALALAYAQAYPQRVRGLLLGSVFLARERDAQWAFSGANGISRLFPDLAKVRQEFFDQHQLTLKTAAATLLAQMESATEEQVKDLVVGVANWENNLMYAFTDVTLTEPEEVEAADIDKTKIFLHYESNNFFLEPNQLLKNLEPIQDIPTIIVHGRYDVLCPAEQAWAVHKGLYNSEIVILPTSNHRLTADGAVAREWAYKAFLQKHN